MMRIFPLESHRPGNGRSLGQTPGVLTQVNVFAEPEIVACRDNLRGLRAFFLQDQRQGFKVIGLDMATIFKNGTLLP